MCVCVSANGERRKIERWAGSLHVYSKACFPRKLLIIHFSRTIHSHAPSSHQKTSTKPLSRTHTPAGIASQFVFIPSTAQVEMRLFKDINTFSTISAQLRLAPENPLNF